ncbi:ribonucleases P/MRP protein subunit POP1-like [Canna indica]|uniref:Ribonucleases P/MRP protein subunit POP1-like n=1 Tax=Canna indica TaxID=4628 RepID=A0AAQ3JWE8_9LILI|nr:ribonucleases P/MRP protein subunit POP1-like [Canna indica]
MASKSGKPSLIPSISLPPPRILNVQKFAESRAPELNSLHSIISTRLNNDFRIRRDKRRRTTGHKTATKNHRGSKRRKLGSGDGSQPENQDNQKTKKVPRRIRRRMEFQNNPPSGFVTSGEGTKRLRTHLWHAKRFRMVKRWGFYLPLGLHGRGRGSRAVLRWSKRGALVHDASYCLPIQIEGPEEYIVAILRLVLFPLSPTPSSGAYYENSMLYYVGAPVSKFIAPIIYMWRPLSGDDHITVVKDGVFNNSSIRKLWIWIHAAAYDEGFDVLNNACQMQMHEFGANVNCITLQGQIARLDVMGSKATDMLKKILHPVPQSSTNPQIRKSLVLSHAEKLPSHSILSLTVSDPRDLPSCGIEDTNNELSTILESDMPREDSFCASPDSGGIFIPDTRSLWDCDSNLCPPIPESILCKEKHDRRLKTFYLEPCNSNLYSSIGECILCKKKSDGHLKDFYLEPCSHGGAATEEKDASLRCCSILLLKHAQHGSFSAGWSIILPLSWVKVFWMSLVSHGFRAIGLRERRWVACNSGLPSFPSDFPDSKAYSSFMADEAAASARESELRPPAVRPLKVPIPPPWNCIVSTLRKGPNMFMDFRKLHVETSAGVVPESPIVSLDSKDIVLSSECQHTEIFPGFVSRTSEVLDKNGYRNLLSSFKIQIPKNGTPTNMMDISRKLCFVRVLLHAHKEGVFEEGAVVCAPMLTDLSRWTSRSDSSEGEEDHEELQLPQSFVKSFFTEQEPGRWELLEPQDPSIKQSFRWPIGFVTTSFVYGSSKPVAVAFCEARLVAMLRKQQSSHIQITEPTLFVFVVNTRSTAYRRAQATIVLEHQNDVEFM